MKFECPSCGKKYSLPDEKVPTGKDFKVKCKKCGEIIVLHGPEAEQAPAEEPVAQPPLDEAPAGPFDQPADPGAGPDEQPTQVFDYSRMSSDGGIQGLDSASAQAEAFQPPAEEAGPEASGDAGWGGAEDEWHIAVDGEQMGPYGSDQIREMLQAGQITDETFIWRDGFDDWLPVREVPDFSMGGEAGAVPAAAPAADSPFAISSGGGGQDLFAGSGGGEESPFGAPAGESDAGVQTSLGAEPQDPRVDATGLKGARHENSVLFSLSSLQALASSSKDPSAGAAGPSLGAPGAAGSATTEGGSGLIDIKTLTAGTQSAGGSGAPADDILSIGGGGLGAQAGVPNLLQPVKKEPSKLPYIIAGVVGLVVIAGTAVTLALVLGNRNKGSEIDEETLRKQIIAELMAQEGMTQKEAEKLADKRVEEKIASEDSGGSGDEGAEASEGEGEESAGDATGGKKKGGKKGKKGGGSAGGSGSSESSGSGDKGSSGGGGSTGGGTSVSKSTEDDLMALLEGGVKKGGGKKGGGGSSKGSTSDSGGGGSSGGSTASLPEKPTKQDVMKALNKVKPAVNSCGKGQTGVATVSINIAGSTGKVASAKVVSGPFKGTPNAGCIEKAVKKAKFPKFKQSKFSVSYPFVIK